MQHNLGTIKMHDRKIKPTLFTYRDFFIEILMERFGDDQKKKWLANNPTLTPSEKDLFVKQIDTCISKFDKIRHSTTSKVAKNAKTTGVPTGHDRFDISKYKDWTSFELFVDYVTNQTQSTGEKLSDNLEVTDGKPLFEKNGLEVYYADTPRACIKYKGNVDYSWCIARPDSSNMFYTYRFRANQPAFYFVKDVEETKKEFSSNEKFNGKFKNKWHFFVIQVLKDAKTNDVSDKNYVVTSADNDGDEEMSWNEIVKIEPKLKGLQKEFLPKPLSSEEKAKVDKYKDGITSQEFATLPYEEKERFLDIYPSIKKPISDEIFDLMPDDLKNKYIGFGIGMTDKQYNIVKNNNNLLKRYILITERKFQEWLKKSNQFKLVDSEMDVLIKYNILDKYIDKLSDDNIRDLLSSSNNKQQTIDLLLSKNVPLTDNNVSNLLQYSLDKQKFIDFLLSKGLSIDKILTNDVVYSLLRDSNNLQQTINVLFNKNVPLTDDNIRDLLQYSPNKQQTIDLFLSKGLSIDKIFTSDNMLYFLENSTDVTQTIDLFLSKGLSIDKILTNDVVYSLLTKSRDTQKTVDLLLSKNVPFTDNNVSNLLWGSTEKEKLIDFLLSKGLSIDKILTDRNVSNLLHNSRSLHNSRDTQKLIKFFLSKDVPLTNNNVNTLLSSSPEKEKTIDLLLDKNVPFTDDNVSSLLQYSPYPYYTQQKIDTLKAKQQQLKIDKLKYAKQVLQPNDFLQNLGRDGYFARKRRFFESKFTYRDFFTL